MPSLSKQDGCPLRCVLECPQDTVFLQLEVVTAVLPTAAIYTCSVATIQTLTRRADRRMKTTLFSESFGAFISPLPPGNKSAQRVTCQQSWPPCQVRTPLCALKSFLDDRGETFVVHERHYTQMRVLLIKRLACVIDHLLTRLKAA